MHIFDELLDKETWLKLKDKKADKHLANWQIKDFERFIENEKYLPIVEKIKNKIPFDHPKKAQISKVDNQKKRVVYTYKHDENMVLKLLTYLLIRKYDYLFAPNLYSFRANHSVKNAINFFTNKKSINKMYSYKVDISNYFNSIDISILLKNLKPLLNDDELYDFIELLLKDPYVYENNKLITEQKGIMAGTPIAAFLANIYLREMDWYFYNKKVLYARYSDDIIIFAKTPEKLQESIDDIKHFLSEYHLTVNQKKEVMTKPTESWTFLGFKYENGEIDVADVSFRKLKMKMHRKCKALLRWKDRHNLDNVRAAKAFVKLFNRKLYESPRDNELTWTLWYFPTITTTKTLEKIDEYQQDCIRYLATGKRTKGRFNFRYEDIKNLGYRSLVHEYYLLKEKTYKENHPVENINDK